jgi:hypothetical protein
MNQVSLAGRPNLAPDFQLYRQLKKYPNDESVTIYNCPANAIVCIKTLIQMSRTKSFKITPTCFDHQLIIIRELFDPG